MLWIGPAPGGTAIPIVYHKLEQIAPYFLPSASSKNDSLPFAANRPKEKEKEKDKDFSL